MTVAKIEHFCETVSVNGAIMTRGKRIAWISAVSAAALVTLSSSFASVIERDAQVCAGSYSIAAFAACLRILSYEQSTTDARTIALRKLANFAIGLNQDDLAIQRLTSLIELGTATSEDWKARGRTYFMQGDLAKALADFDQAVAMDPGNISTLNDRGGVRYQSGDFQGALSDYNAALKIDKDHVASLTNRARAQSTLGKKDEAGKDIDRALALDGDFLPARIEKSWQLLKSGHPDQVLAEIKRAGHQGPPDPLTLQLRAYAYFKQGLFNEAVADAEQAMAQDETLEWPYMLRAQARRNAGDFEKALADANRILKRRPTDVDALTERACSLLLSRQVEAALSDIDQIMKLHPDPAYGYQLRAGLNFAIGRLEAAEADARQSLALAPRSPDALVAFAWMRLHRQAPQEAMQYCNEALLITESDLELRCRAIASLTLNELAAASADSDRALALDQFGSANHYVAGRVALARGNPLAAKARFDTALKLYVSDSVAAYMYRGDAWRALGNLDQARLDYQEAKKRDLGFYASALADRLSAVPAP